jgi:hypothetical protein
MASPSSSQVVTVLLASGVGAGFGATIDALRYVHHVTRGGTTRQGRISSAILVGMVLSMAATVVSARLRARAADDDVSDL